MRTPTADGIVHRDIKLDNFIYENEREDSELKLIDFGFACEVSELCRGRSHLSNPKSNSNGFRPARSRSAEAVSTLSNLTQLPRMHTHTAAPRSTTTTTQTVRHCLIRAPQIKPGREAMWDQLGTPSYMAPELWSKSETEYDSSVDMWAIGVVTYMLLSGKRPFHHQDKREKARMIRNDPLKFPGPEFDRISDDVRIVV